MQINDFFISFSDLRFSCLLEENSVGHMFCAGKNTSVGHMFCAGKNTSVGHMFCSG